MNKKRIIYEFNQETLKEQYSNIQKTCIIEGIPVPTLIVANDIPLEYRLNPRKIGNIIQNTERNNLEDKMSIEYEIIRGESKNYSTLYEYWEDELGQFLKNHPQYNSIITPTEDTP